MFEQTQQSIDFLARKIGQRQGNGRLIIAIDGRSGVGKSTLAAGLAQKMQAVCIEGDDFFAGGVDLREDAAEALAAACIDWRRQRRVLEQLKQGRSAQYNPFDWQAFDGSLSEIPVQVQAREIILLEGVYSARPELRDLVDLTVLVRLPEAERQQRLLAREGEISDWERQWHRAEDWYFDNIAPESSFDLVVDG